MLEYEWEFNVLGVYNYKKPGKLDAYYDWIRNNHLTVEGDVVEAGVFRGRSLLATALLLKELGSNKRVIGFDSFSGFPPIYHANDQLECFRELHQQGRITDEHLLAHEKLVSYRGMIKSADIDVRNISSSEAFEASKLEDIQSKIEFLELDNILLVEGSFEDTRPEFHNHSEAICALLLDCDLYESYRGALNCLWPHVSDAGFVFLDEYFSLKFPGARIACDEFFAQRNQRPKRIGDQNEFFERWAVLK